MNERIEPVLVQTIRAVLEHEQVNELIAQLDRGGVAWCWVGIASKNGERTLELQVDGTNTGVYMSLSRFATRDTQAVFHTTVKV